MKKILVVDDEPDFLKITAICLKKEGYDVLVALDGKQALDMVKKMKPDLVLLDVQIPDANGYEVFDKMQAHAPLAKIPVIFISGDANVERIGTSQNGKGVGHLLKPFDAKTLVKKVKEYLS